MLDITRQYTANVSLLGIEIIALEKLSLVSHALASKIGGQAGKEQEALVVCLDSVVRQLKLAAIGAK